MADTRLVGLAQLAEGPSEGRIEEDRIVAVTIRSARGHREQAFDRALGLEHDSSRRRQRERADESCGAPAAAALVKPGVYLLKTSAERGIRAEKAGRAQARLPVKRLDLEPRVFGHGQKPGLACIVGRLQPRVFHVGRAGFLCRGKVRTGRQGPQLERQARQQGDNFAHLVGIGGSDQEDPHLSGGGLLLRGEQMSDVLTLEGDELLNPTVCQIEQREERLTSERPRLRGSLHLDITAGAGLDDVHVDFGA